VVVLKLLGFVYIRKMFRPKAVILLFVTILVDRLFSVTAFNGRLGNRYSVQPVRNFGLLHPSFINKREIAMSIFPSADSNPVQLSEKHSHKSLKFQQFRSNVATKLGSFARYAAPLLMQMSVIVLFSAVHPAFAKAAKKTLSKAPAAAVKPPLWKKILEG
jgi:hypothetical protein